MNDQPQQWASVLSALASRPISHPEAVLKTALRLGLSVTPDALACSLTQQVGSGYRTTVSTDQLAVDLDQIQYAAGA